MKFGNYIKEQRTRLNMTQPEAAERIGIEQSYLSKLETGKSTPSDDIFKKLQNTYSFNTDHLAEVLSSEELLKLTEIAAVRESVSALEKRRVSSIRAWLITGLFSLMAGGALVAMSLIPDTSYKEYLYRSEGLLLPGEPLTTFSKANVYGATVRSHISDETSARDRLTVDQHKALIERIDQKYKVFPTDRGSSFVEDDENGRRYYSRIDIAVKNSESRLKKWALVPGIALLIGGLACFYLAREWRRPIR